MNKTILYIFAIITIFPLFSCQKKYNQSKEIDNISYINDFELLQKNVKNNTRIKITSPQAIIDPSNNDLEILDSSIEILNSKGREIKVKSGKSSLNNKKNLIRVYNNVNISLLNNKNSSIKTNSFDWDLNKSIINLNNPLFINFENTQISSSSGYYNIQTDQLNINNNIFNRNILNNDGKTIYQIKILADMAKWIKIDNSLEFNSTDKQVESTIYFLSIK